MTTEEVDKMIEKFGDAALRAKEAGFDGVQIHGAHGYLVCEFASAYSNKRTDKYGGNLINRMRFPVEIVKNIRQKCGDDFLIDYKISGEECTDGGTNIEDIITCIACLQGCAGKIDTGFHSGCTLNPRTVMEDELQITPLL